MMACQKMAFDSRAEVNAWVRRANSGSHYGPAVRKGHAYWCRTCEAWHWTSMSKAEARRRGLT